MAHLSAEARQAVLAFGWNTTCYQILNPGMQYWFSADRKAVVGYTRRHSVLLAAGGPVCDAKELPAVCEQFEAFAAAMGCKVFYVCAENGYTRYSPPPTGIQRWLWERSLLGTHATGLRY